MLLATVICTDRYQYVTNNCVVNAIFTSPLDYCISLQLNKSSFQTARLQRVQNNADILVIRTSRNDHITPLVMGLHWMSIESCVTFEVLVLAYIHALEPTYLELEDVYRRLCTWRNSLFKDGDINVPGVEWQLQ